MDLGLSRKRIFISASSDGIGKATAEGFLQEGAFVVLNGRNKEKLKMTEDLFKEKYGKESVGSICADMSDENIIKSTCKELEGRYGGFDVIVANLGSGKAIGSDQYSPAEWSHMMKINLYSAVLLLQEITVGNLIADCGGSVALIASLAAFERIGAPPAYAAAKSGIVSLVKYAAPSLWERKIRINAVSPGNVYYKGGRWEELYKKDPIGTKTYLEMEVPMKRFCRPEEIAAAVVFLCSGKSSFTTGSILQIDGGQGRGY